MDDDVVDVFVCVVVIVSVSVSVNDVVEVSVLMVIVEWVIEFGCVDNVMMWRSVVSVCEMLGKVCEGWLGVCVCVLGEMMWDEDVGMVKRVSAGVGALFREALIVSAVKGNVM